MGGAELRGSYENYYYAISYLLDLVLFVTVRSLAIFSGALSRDRKLQLRRCTSSWTAPS
jgi:hypothetical protein